MHIYKDPHQTASTAGPVTYNLAESLLNLTIFGRGSIRGAGANVTFSKLLIL